MMLARIAPMPNQQDHEKLTFECAKCGNEITQVVKLGVQN
jgi:hypothetical protein